MKRMNGDSPEHRRGYSSGRPAPSAIRAARRFPRLFPTGPAQPKPPGRTRDLSGSDLLLSCVMGSSTTAERRRLAIAAPPMSPSAVSTASASAIFALSRLNSPRRTIAAYASSRTSPPATQHSLPSRRYPLLGRDFHPLDHISFRDALTGADFPVSGDHLFRSATRVLPLSVKRRTLIQACSNSEICMCPRNSVTATPGTANERGGLPAAFESPDC
jgi:hypothetical protein